MKRSATLIPLSREHHAALTLAKACERAALSGSEDVVIQTCQRALREFENQLQPHFQLEEESLLPLLTGIEHQPLVERTLAEHQNLRGLLNGLQQNDGAALATFGTSLAGHVRFEERELFPILDLLLD